MSLVAYQVTSLPSVPFDVGEMYSGNMPLKAGDKSRELFFIFQPTIGAPVDEITVWLNGGPGCSSLEGNINNLGSCHALRKALTFQRLLPRKRSIPLEGRRCCSHYQPEQLGQSD
jgi:hypothetical protein